MWNYAVARFDRMDPAGLPIWGAVACQADPRFARYAFLVSQNDARELIKMLGANLATIQDVLTFVTKMVTLGESLDAAMDRDHMLAFYK